MDMRCLIVDDNARFLETARGVLERDDITVVELATNDATAHGQNDRHRPNIVLVDVCLGDECGVELADRLAVEARSKPTVNLISTYAEDDFADIVAGST